MTCPLVVYWNNIPSPYMVERFNALADRGAFEFEAWFNDRIVSDRSWDVDESSWRFKYRYVSATRIGKHVLHWPWLALTRRPDVLISLYAEPVFIFGWLFAKLRGSKTGFWVEVTFDRWIKRRAYKAWIRRWLFRRTDAIVTVGADGRRFAERAGAAVEKIFYAPHVIDVSHYANGARLTIPYREQLRSELGLHGTTFVYVGSLRRLKGVVYLLGAFAAAQTRCGDEVSLLLVGDGPDEAKLKQHCAELGLRNVVFAGFKQKPEVPRYFALADVFVFPTLGDTYGLVVDEAMACWLPVICTSSAGEIRDRVEDADNGYIVPPDDSEALATRMLELAHDPGLRLRMGRRSAEKIAGHTPERWAQDFAHIVETLLVGKYR